MIEINTQLTQQDFIRFNLTTFLRKPLMWLYAFFIGFIFASFFFDFNQNGIEAYATAGLLEQLLPLLFILVFYLFLCWTIYRQSKRNYSTTSSVHEPITYTFSAEGIHSRGKSFDSDIKWELVHKVQETRDWFLIYQNNVAANLIPKSAFESHDEVTAFKTLIKSQKNLKHKLRKN